MIVNFVSHLTRGVVSHSYFMLLLLSLKPLVIERQDILAIIGRTRSVVPHLSRFKGIPMLGTQDGTLFMIGCC